MESIKKYDEAIDAANKAFVANLPQELYEILKEKVFDSADYRYDKNINAKSCIKYIDYIFVPFLTDFEIENEADEEERWKIKLNKTPTHSFFDEDDVVEKLNDILYEISEDIPEISDMFGKSIRFTTNGFDWLK